MILRHQPSRVSVLLDIQRESTILFVLFPCSTEDNKYCILDLEHHFPMWSRNKHEPNISMGKRLTLGLRFLVLFTVRRAFAMRSTSRINFSSPCVGFERNERPAIPCHCHANEVPGMKVTSSHPYRGWTETQLNISRCLADCTGSVLSTAAF
jgi:hypothetical protein